MKRGLIVRHVPYEGIAGYRAPIEAAGYVLDRVTVGEASYDAVDWLAPDLLIVMGGPMGVYETDRHPWLTTEIAGVAARLAADKPTLGICLGAQIVAAALGARVYPGSAKEMGFAPLFLRPEARTTPVRHLADVPVLHWHGDTFDLPPGVDLLASTAAYRNQIFRRGTNLLALQCHAEMGEDERFDAWLESDAHLLPSAGTDAATVRADHDRIGRCAMRAGQSMIAEWLRGLP